MIVHDCWHCGAPVSLFAKSCAYCGAANRARLGGIAVAGALAFLFVAFVIAAVLVLWWPKNPAAPQGAPETAEQQPAAGAAGDFAWLTTAMQDCEAEAGKTPRVLHFLVIPLGSQPTDEAQWRAKSLNAIGNAILLNSKDSLDALQRGALRISRDQYVFRVRDEATGAIYQWKPSVGVAKFSSADADAVAAFKVQFRKNDQAPDDWGNPFNRQAGTCYWVNAVIGN